MARQTVRQRAKLALFEDIIPQFSFNIAGIGVMFNYRMQTVSEADGLISNPIYHQWFALTLLDVDIIRIAKREVRSNDTDSKQYDFCWSLFGYQNRSRSSSTFPFSVEYIGSVAEDSGSRVDWRILSHILAAALFCLASMHYGALFPEVVKTILPIFMEPIGLLSVFQLLVCFRAVSTLSYLQLALYNLVKPSKTNGVKGRIMPFIHPVVISFLISVPFIATGTYPVVATLTAIGLSTLYDVLKTGLAFFAFNWNMIFMHVSILGCENRPVKFRDGISRPRLFHVLMTEFPIVDMQSSWTRMREFSRSLSPYDGQKLHSAYGLDQ